MMEEEIGTNGMNTSRRLLLGTLLIGAATLCAQIKDLKPGFDFFTPQQDVQMGKEAKAQVEQQQPVVHDPRITGYLTGLGQRLAQSPHAGNWPFSFNAISDKNINAFALPGGPIFVNTATIAAADNEAQLAGVLAHEMSHVVLRHGTHEVSKQNLIELPAMLAGSVMGNGLWGRLGQMGVSLAANSAILKYSRDAESQADYNGALIMADAGYNPVEMARFFEKLQAQGGGNSALSQFLSDHPNPGNRVKAVEQEIQYIPQRTYRDNITGEFAGLKAYVARLPAPPPKR
jgi:beta-barrel assembly-enhancing protease